MDTLGRNDVHVEVDDSRPEVMLALMTFGLLAFAAGLAVGWML